jgi:hypothetical protein
MEHGHDGNQSDFIKHFKGHASHQFAFTKINKKNFRNFKVTT